MIVQQKGQAIMEAVLILVVMMAVLFATASFFKDQEILKKMISDPWQNLAGLLQNGVWGSPDATNISHPNAHGRHVVIQGESAK